MHEGFLTELRSRNEMLYRFGWANVFLFAVAFALFFFDRTVISGVNAWIKPMKFAISVTIYGWTFAWLLHYLQDEGRRKLISRGIIVCMIVEVGLIYLQAARGVVSHFNIETTFDAAVFNTMGVFIVFNTSLLLYTIALFFSEKTKLVGAPLWAWRIGLIFFFLGGVSGGVMSTFLSHTFGAKDGGPGLPLLNWSTVAGDIRSAHFFTLHGLQIIPLAGFAFERWSSRHASLYIFLFAGLYGFGCAWLHWIAIRGIPLISDY